MSSLYYRIIRKIGCGRLSLQMRGAPGPWSGRGKGKVIFLTFDDGPNEVYTPQLLALLRSWEVKATFFVIGDALQQHRHVGWQIVEEGHVLGNHSASHRLFNRLPTAEALEEIISCQKVIDRIQPETNRLFRPPSGYVGIAALRAMASNGFVPSFWTKDSRDSSTNCSVERVVDRLRDIRDNCVILFHDDSPICIEALSVLLPYWKKRGHEFRVLTEFLAGPSSSGEKGRP